MESQELHRGYMRRLLLAGLLFASAFPTLAVQHVTVDELRQSLIAQKAAHRSDGKTAQSLGDVELTERLSEATLQKWKTEIGIGPHTAQALRLLGDQCALLIPPASELPNNPAPSTEEIQAMFRAAVHYVATTLHRLPNFIATRETQRFENIPSTISHSGGTPPHSDLHAAGRTQQELTYRDGEELDMRKVASDVAHGKPDALPPWLVSRGEFGAILAVVLRDATKGKIAWRRWEQTPMGLAAVFHFQVTAQSSHYAVDYCCVYSPETRPLAGADLKSGSLQNAYHDTPAYHGDLFIDPASGAVLRLTVESELKPTDPIQRSMIAVEYGWVEIGGEDYICPTHSIAVSQGWALLDGETSMRTILRVNETSFTRYHRFGSTASIVPVEPAP